jgi:hypothetical protein
MDQTEVINLRSLLISSHVYRWINCEMPTLMIWKEDEPNYQLRDLCIRMDKDYNFQLRTTVCTKVLDYIIVTQNVVWYYGV